MKKILLSIVLLLSVVSYSQNIQLLYDFGKSRSADVIPTEHNFFSLTYEMLKFDSAGGYTYAFF